MQMELDVFDRYVEAIPILTAREGLMSLNITTYPHAKKTSQDKIYKALTKQANPKIETSKQLSTADLARIIGGARG